MNSVRKLTIGFALILIGAFCAQAQQTSRVIPFNNVVTTIPAGTAGQALTIQVWDVATGGTTALFSENQTLDVDANGAISFVLGAATPSGLDPSTFASGTSRFLDVVDSSSTSVLAARIPLNAVAFALSPGPEGPAGPTGPQGLTGPPGPVSSVVPGDASIVVAGSMSVPSVVVATNGITNAKVADGALSPAKVTGTAATLGANTFNGDQAINGGFRAHSGSGTVIQGLTNAGVDAVLGIGCCLASVGVHGIAQVGSAGVALKADVERSDGTLIIGNGPGGVRVFRVDSAGRTFANGGFQASGADFAESVAVEKERSLYEPGDVLAIDPTADRRLKLASGPYSTGVAGIYSTRPGVLATPYQMDDPRIAQGVPLAIVGIVPCKASAENGPIQRGDLLVVSSRPGYAMKGTNRKRLVGAVVGKALEPLLTGNGVIQVLVTLQ